MTADADLTSILDSYRSDQRPQALVRLDDGVCRIIAASRIMLQAIGAPDETGLVAWLEGKGGSGLLTRHAESREALTHDLGGGQSLVFSIREQSPGVFQIRGSKVGPAEVSNSLTAGIIANIVNEETGILFLDPQNRVLAVNDTFYRFFPKADGYPQIGESYETLLRDSVRRGYLPTSTGREETFIQGTLDHFASESPQPLMVLTSNGRWANTSRLRFSNGAVAILMIDVTERETEIDQYKTFVRNTRNMIYCRVEEGGQFGRVWGQDAHTMAGIADEDGNVEIRDWLKAMHPEDLPAYLDVAHRRMADDSPYRIEYRLMHPTTGETRNMLESGWVTIDRATGERHLDCYLIDITAQKRIETQLKSSEQRFREFASLAGDWYFEADRDLNITYLSDGFESISGMSTDIFLGVSWEKITRNAVASMEEKHHAAWFNLLEAWKAGRPTHDHRMVFRFASGIERTISTSGEVMLDGDGRRVGYRGVAKDVSSLIEAEERAIEERQRAEAANRAKSEFIANMSHELRTPLNAIIGFAGVMEQQMFGPIDNERYRSYAGDISASGQHLLSLVNDILDLSRIEADRHSYDPEWLDLEDEIERVCVLFREESGGRALSPENSPKGGRVWADRRAFRQVLINLVGNAIKFTPDDGHIRIAGACTMDGACIRVIDDGPGMSTADAQLALEPFGRAASSEIAGGTGLGLPITRKLVEMHGGELELDTAPGAGCSVTASFPMPDASTGAEPADLRSGTG